MPGCSATPLVRKLGLKPGHRVALVNAPAGFQQLLDGLPDDVRLARGLTRSAAEVFICFVTSGARLIRRLAAAAGQATQNGATWIAGSKKAGNVPDRHDRGCYPRSRPAHRPGRQQKQCLRDRPHLVRPAARDPEGTAHTRDLSTAAMPIRHLSPKWPAPADHHADGVDSSRLFSTPLASAPDSTSPSSPVSAPAVPVPPSALAAAAAAAPRSGLGFSTNS